MTMPLHRDREALMRELKRQVYQELFEDLRVSDPVYEELDSWDELRERLSGRALFEPDADALLAPMLEAHADIGDFRIRAVLLVLFWPVLRQIHRGKRHWLRDEAERWQEILLSFLEEAVRFDPAQVPGEFAKTLRNRTFNRFYRRCQCRWRHIETHDGLGEDDVRVPNASGEVASATEPANQELVDAVTQLLRSRDRGKLTAEEYRLVLRTRVFGESLADFADRRGLNYEATKKRRQRAEAVLRGESSREEPNGWQVSDASSGESRSNDASGVVHLTGKEVSS